MSQLVLMKLLITGIDRECPEQTRTYYHSLQALSSDFFSSLTTLSPLVTSPNPVIFNTEVSQVYISSPALLPEPQVTGPTAYRDVSPWLSRRHPSTRNTTAPPATSPTAAPAPSGLTPALWLLVEKTLNSLFHLIPHICFTRKSHLLYFKTHPGLPWWRSG